MAYFEELPNISQPSLLSGSNKIEDRVIVKNLFKRSKLRTDVDQAITAFNYYYVEDQQRPDILAQELYGDSELDWVVLTSNNITNVRDQWPLEDNDLHQYMLEKYKSNDGNLDSNTATVTITVNAIDDAPTIGDPITVNVSRSTGSANINTVSFQVDITDPDVNSSSDLLYYMIINDGGSGFQHHAYISSTWNSVYPTTLESEVHANYGSDIEIFSKRMLEEASNIFKSHKDREHVTFQFWDGRFSCNHLKIGWKEELSINDIRLTVDYKEDIEVIKLIAKEINIVDSSLLNICKTYKKLDLNKINGHFDSKAGWK